MYPSDFRTSFSGLKSRRLGNGAGVGGGWRTMGHWGQLRHRLWKLMLSWSRKSSQGKARKGNISFEPLPSYPTLGQTPD